MMNGSVYISHDVLADIAGAAAMEGYGVVGMASQGLIARAANLLPGQRLRKGVQIASVGVDDAGHEVVEVDLFVVIEYGSNLTEVSRNLSSAVVYSLETLAQVSVARCDVHVVDVKVR